MELQGVELCRYRYLVGSVRIEEWSRPPSPKAPTPLLIYFLVESWTTSGFTLKRRTFRGLLPVFVDLNQQLHLSEIDFTATLLPLERD